MSEVLKKFISPNLEGSTQRDYNVNLAKGISSDTNLDYNRPFTYFEWAAQNASIRDDLKKSAYQKYTERWYSSRFDKQTSDTIVKNQYIELIERLQFIFKDDENFKRLANVNLDDPYDIEVLIPLISKKLRDIALYYAQQRANVKKTKIKYNTAGSNAAVERLFGEYILKNFTNSKYQTTVIENSAFASLPELSAIKGDFKIIIQELYDTSSYFDKSSKNISAYDDLKESFITELGVDNKGNEFYNNLGVYDTLINNPLFFDLTKYISDVSNIATSATVNLDGVDSNRLSEFKVTAKYLGTDLYYISGGYYVPKTEQLNIPIQTGSNLFYWPSGEFAYGGTNNFTTYKELPINDSKFLTLGTAAADYENADKVFVSRCGYGVKGAWLQKGSTVPLEDVFKIEIQGALKCEGRTLMRYPFPGRGYFTDNTWTGIQTNGLINKTYFTEEELARLENLYWNTTVNDVLSTADPLAINDSFLVEDGANAGKLYSQADHLWIRQTENVDRINDETPDGVFNNAINDYWLYKYQKTALPIKAQVSLNETPTTETGTHIFWPHQSFPTIEDYNPLPSYAYNHYKVALPVALASLNVYKEFAAAKAGGTQFDSDVILKVDECGTIKDAAILLGEKINNFNSTSWGKFVFPNRRLDDFNYILSAGYIQPGLVFKANPNQVVPFVWQANGSKFGDVSDVPDTKLNDLNAFRGVKHEPNCAYHNTDVKSIFNYREELAKTVKCTCKAINYSPLGHKGNKINSFDYLTDLIFEVTDPKDLNKFDIDEWKDSKGKTWQYSDRIAYFKLDRDNKDKDVGWGTGKWVTSSGVEFMLRPGVIYGYYRNGRLACSASLSNLYLIINHQYCDIKEYPTMKEEFCYAYDFMYDFRPRWVDLVVDPDVDLSEWRIKTYDNSAMVFNPGDHLVYIHRDKNDSTVHWTGLLDTETNNSTNITLQYDMANFIWQSKLYGWDYTTNKWTGSPSAYGARPYWALADEFCAANEFNLSIGSGRVVEYDYLFNIQPKFATDYIKHFDTIEYFRRSENSFIWSQNFTLNSSAAQDVWREISLVEKEPNIKHNCSVDVSTEYKCYGLPPEFDVTGTEGTHAVEVKAFDKILIVQSLTAESDIIFESSSLDQPVNILYCAKNPFTFTQELTDLSVGLPPYGGLYVPVSSGILVKAEKPYANLLNVNNPTVAFVESNTNIFAREELGIYTPDNMALGVYNGAELEKEPNTANDYKDKIFSIIDPNSYLNNRGLSDVDSSYILNVKSTDASSLKYPPTAGNKSGDVRYDGKYSNFTAYQSSFETKGNNALSIPFNEKFDPWGGAKEDEWIDTINFNPNLYGEYNLLSGDNSWYESRFNETSSIIHNIQTDVFGNYYVLFKSASGSTIYDASNLYGTLYVKDLNNKTLPAVSALKNVYAAYKIKHPTIYCQLTANRIKNIEVFYDTIVTHLSAAVLIDRINEDFESGEIFSSAERPVNNKNESSFVITLSSPIGNASTLLISDENILTVMYMSSGAVITPVVYEHILGSDIIQNVYNNTNDIATLSAPISSHQLSSFYSPQLSYDPDSGIYTITTMAKAINYGDSFFTLFYNYKKANNLLTLQGFNILKPYT